MTALRSRSRRRDPRALAPSRAFWRLGVGVLRLLRGLVAAAALVVLIGALPWALWHYIGWPLPTHAPTWAEVQAVLLGPMTMTFLLNLLACLCWITWAAFTVDAVRCGVTAGRGIRRPTYSTAGPVHAVAAILVGAVMLSMLGNRSTQPARAPQTSITATTPHRVPSSGRPTVIVRHVAFSTHADDVAMTDTPSRPESVVVRAPDPQTGVHDSLWRIAQRTLGNGARWPEIFTLNEGQAQPGGGRLTRPSLIYPGEELALPPGATMTLPPHKPRQPAPRRQSTDTPSPKPPSLTVTPEPSTPHAPLEQAPTNPAYPTSGEFGFGWGVEVFVGLGLAAAVSAALLVARRRHRREYQPGSGRRDDLPVAPVVYQLRLAHLRTQREDEDPDDEQEEGTDDRRPTKHSAAPPVVVGAESEGGSGPAPELGVRDGCGIALNLAASLGLGLVGAGARASARAVVVTALTALPADSTDHRAPSAGVKVVVPAEDMADLLGLRHQDRRPAGLRMMPGLDAALDELEAETLARARCDEQHGSRQGWPAVVLVARSPEYQRERLQAVLDNGSAFGIVGVLLGQWRPGITTYVRDDGTISATSPGLGEALRGTSMFRLGDDHTTDLLDLLCRAEPEPPTTGDASAPAASRPRAIGTDSSATARPADRSSSETAEGAPPAADSALELAAEAGASGQANVESDVVAPNGAHLPGSARESPAGSDGHEPTGIPRARVAATDETDAASAPVQVTVLGQPRVYWRVEPGREPREITGALQPRTRELLIFLAVHPDGATRDALMAALWAESSQDKTTNALNTALSRLRRALTKATDGDITDIAVIGDGRYQLDPTQVDVDYWRFERAVTARRTATTENARIDAYREIVNSYGGQLADGMSTEWIEPVREAIRRDAIDAVAALARALVHDDPQQTLDLLEVARAFDPHNELLYRDIMRLQQRLGHLDAIDRTLTLLTTRLAEIDEQPTPEAIELATRLRQRHDDPSRTPGTPTDDTRRKGQRNEPSATQ